MDAREVLRAAADHIEMYGLQHGGWVAPSAMAEGNPTKLETRTCPACAGGAMAIALSDGKDYSPNFLGAGQMSLVREACALVVAELRLSSNRGSIPALDEVIEWSDSHTKDEVVAGLRQAAG